MKKMPQAGMFLPLVLILMPFAVALIVVTETAPVRECLPLFLALLGIVLGLCGGLKWLLGWVASTEM